MKNLVLFGIFSLAAFSVNAQELFPFLIPKQA